MKRPVTVLVLILAAALTLTFAACSVKLTAPQSEAPAETPAAPHSEAPDEPAAAPSAPAGTAKPTAPADKTPEPTPEATPEPSAAPDEAPPPEETAPAGETPDLTLMTPEELDEWVDEQGGDIGAILSGLQGMELDLGHAPGEYGKTVDFLPEEYEFLFPDGLREGDFVTEATDGYNVTLVGRTPQDFDELVSLAEADGYVGRKTDGIMGISVYEGYKGAYVLEMLYSAGTVEIGRGLPDW